MCACGANYFNFAPIAPKSCKNFFAIPTTGSIDFDGESGKMDIWIFKKIIIWNAQGVSQ